MDIEVYKFGGASVKDVVHCNQVVQIVADNAHSKLVVIVSAIGKTTNALEGAVLPIINDTPGEANALLGEFLSVHLDMATEMDLPSEIHAKLKAIVQEVKDNYEALGQMPYDKAYDQIVSIGELCSSVLLNGLLVKNGLNSVWVDARKVVATNDIHRDATVLWDETESLMSNKVKSKLEDHEIVVSQGFIAGNNGLCTTLGREGSDYTAAIFSYCLNANSLTIWKDVPGILTGDPREFESVSKLDRLSYKEAIEMTYYGAKVIHPKTIKPLQNKGIKLFVKPFLAPTENGTVISEDHELSYPPIVVVEKNQCLLHISTNDFSFVAEHHMSDIFQMIAKHRIKVNMMRNTAISFTVCVTEPRVRLERLIEELRTSFSVVVDRDLELITIRHYLPGQIREILGDRIVLFEERIKDTIQMVVKTMVPMMRKG